MAMLVAVRAVPMKIALADTEPEGERDPVAADPRYNHTHTGNHPVPEREDLLHVELKADDEEEDDGTEMGETPDKIRVRDEPECTRTDEKTDKDQPDDR